MSDQRLPEKWARARIFPKNNGEKSVKSVKIKKKYTPISPLN